MATVSVFNITNISQTRTLNFASAAARDSWFDSYAVGTAEVISSLVDVNAMMVSVPFSGGDILADFTNHYARINQGDVTRYYFITDYRRLNRSQVILNLKLDTVMTFMLLPDSPLQLGSKTLVLREHRDRFNAGAAVYDDMPESTSGEMILKSTSAIAGSSRLHCILRTIPGDESGYIPGRPYWFVYTEGGTAIEITQNATDGFRFFMKRDEFLSDTSVSRIILLQGGATVNGQFYAPPSDPTDILGIFVHRLPGFGDNPPLSYQWFSATSPYNAITAITNVADDLSVMIATIPGNPCKTSLVDTSGTFTINWATASNLGVVGYIPKISDIDLYDGGISKYVVLPYNPMVTADYVTKSLVIIAPSTSFEFAQAIFPLSDLDRGYSTTVTLPTSSYNFTTSGATNAFETAILTVTNGRPDTEIGITLRVKVPTFTSDVTMNVPLPNNTAYTVEELRDFLFTELTGHASLPDVWTLAKSGTDKITFTASIYGAMATNNYAVTSIFSGDDPTVAATTFARTILGAASSRIALNDPKLYTSQFYLPTVTLAGISVPLYREYIPAATTAPTVDITYNSNLEDVGMIVGDSTNFKTLDEGIRVIQLPNRMPLYATDTSTYFQYIKEYDDRLFNIQQSATARNAAVGAINSALSAVVPMVGNESMGVGIAGTRIARAGINIGADIWNAVDNYKSANINRQKSILEMSLSSIDIASTSVEFLIANDLDKIRFSINSVKTEMLNYLDDLFFYQGYATFEMKVPDFDSRTNFNYLMALVDIDMNDLDVVVSDEILADIYNRFKSGITIFHNNEGFIDWNQVKENWED